MMMMQQQSPLAVDEDGKAASDASASEEDGEQESVS